MLLRKPASPSSNTVPDHPREQIGGGTGPWTCIRCGEQREEPFALHRPKNSGIRSCGGTVVRESEVERVRRDERERWARMMRQIARKEAGWVAGEGAEDSQDG